MKQCSRGRDVKPTSVFVAKQLLLPEMYFSSVIIKPSIEPIFLTLSLVFVRPRRERRHYFDLRIVSQGDCLVVVGSDQHVGSKGLLLRPHRTYLFDPLYLGQTEFASLKFLEAALNPHQGLQKRTLVQSRLRCFWQV